ncbi:MAG TPA: A/G-specific adenine glycosylase [Gemmatimonadales bacterium]|jgi:A/G-specific adenine glycosylase|nr:A/G-specific adenine glycosylase [Gemmatimonadales bacterium]
MGVSTSLTSLSGLTPGASPFRRRLLAWFRRSARDLPWRRTRDAYKVLVSEFMLQQTQVSRVLEYYPRFLARYPSVHDLARARPWAVREAWDGLGYYARARNLHALARTVVRRYDGALPDDPRDLVALPGVGRYTAGAVACFAYEKPVATVDTNIARVIRRVWGVRNAERGARSGSAAMRRIWQIAEQVVPRNGKTAWKFNQAMMELGATVCVARKPKCPECPVRAQCRTGTSRRTDAQRRTERRE